MSGQALLLLLYVSELAPDLPASAVGAIIRTARGNNERDGIFGVLVFDGARFAQLVEGPGAAVESLLERLRRDRRHVGMQVLALETTAGPPRFAGWHLGLLASEAEDSGVTALAGLRGAEAVESFCAALLPQLDLEIGAVALQTRQHRPGDATGPVASP